MVLVALAFVLFAFRLVGALRLGVPFRPSFCFSFRSCFSSRHVCSWGGAPFFPALFLVSSCHGRAFPGGGVVLRPGLSSRGGGVSPVGPSIVPSVGSLCVLTFLRLVSRLV